LQTREKELRDELLARAVEQVEGTSFGATITRSIRWTLDTAKTERGRAIKAAFGFVA
jgi:hypothetical protein